MHVAIYQALVYTLDCTLPIHCLQYLKADALCLNPPKLELAGLSADTIETVPRKW